MDVAQLLRPVSDAAPCGPNLEYEPEFLALEQAALGRAEQVVGKGVLPAQPPDWKEVSRQAPALLARSKDLRMAVALTQAQATLEGLSGLADGLELVDGLVRNYWSHVHPQLDADDDDDPTMRMNALAPLADATRLLRIVRDIRLLNVPGFGPLSVRQLEVALGIVQPGADEPTLSVGQVEAMIAAATQAGSVHQVDRALRAGESLAAWLNEQVGADRATDLRPLLGRLRPVAALVLRATAGSAPTQDGAVAQAGAPVDSRPAVMAAAGASAAAAGELRNRDDARRMLERVSQFLEQTEPSNPAPLLIRRAIRLMSMNFLDIVRDLAPESIGTVENIAGAVRDESSSES